MHLMKKSGGIVYTTAGIQQNQTLGLSHENGTTQDCKTMKLEQKMWSRP